MQPREWVMLALLILVPLAIAVVVTLWSIKQMAYTPKKPSRSKLSLSAEERAALTGAGSGADESVDEQSRGASGGSAPPCVGSVGDLASEDGPTNGGRSGSV